MVMLLALVAACLVIAGCSGIEMKEQQVKKELAAMAQAYAKEKYGMLDARAVEVTLSPTGSNGPIPDFKQRVSDHGNVTMEYEGDSFQVSAGPLWNRYTDEIKNVISDDYQTAQIKADIREHLIDKYKVTDEYNLYTYRITSNYIHGRIDFFTLEQTYDGNLDSFLKEHQFGLEMEIFFKGKEKDQEVYFDKAKNLFDQLVSRFGHDEGSISIYVSKEDKYMDEQMTDILDPKNPMAIDPIIYGPEYNYCKVIGETHHAAYAERVSAQGPKSKMRPLEMESYRYAYLDVGDGISLASMANNSDFLTSEDVEYAHRPLRENNLFAGADYSELDPDRSVLYDYYVLNERLYRIGYPPRHSEDGEEEGRPSKMALKVNQSQLPESADRLMLVQQIPSDDTSEGLMIADLSQPYLYSSGNAWFTAAATDREFVIVYRVKR